MKSMYIFIYEMESHTVCAAYRTYKLCNKMNTRDVYWRNMVFNRHFHGKRNKYIIIFISLRAGRSGDRILVGAIFSAAVQTGPWAHPASYTMGTGSFLGVKWQGRGVDQPTPSSAEANERVELCLYSSRPSWPVLG
jgi:hypothetical protein